MTSLDFAPSKTVQIQLFLAVCLLASAQSGSKVPETSLLPENKETELVVSHNALIQISNSTSGSGAGSSGSQPLLEKSWIDKWTNVIDFEELQFNDGHGDNKLRATEEARMDTQSGFREEEYYYGRKQGEQGDQVSRYIKKENEITRRQPSFYNYLVCGRSSGATLLCLLTNFCILTMFQVVCKRWSELLFCCFKTGKGLVGKYHK